MGEDENISERREGTDFKQLHQDVVIKNIWRNDPRYTVLEEQRVFDEVKKKLGGRIDVPDAELEKITHEVINGPSVDKKEPSIEEEVGFALEGIVKENPELPPPPADESPRREITAGPAEVQKPAEQEAKDYSGISAEEITKQLNGVGVENIESVLEKIKDNVPVKRVGKEMHYATADVNAVLQKMIGKTLPGEYGILKLVEEEKPAQKIEEIVKAGKEIPSWQELKKKTLVPREEVVKYLSDKFNSEVVKMMLKRFDENPGKCKGGELYNFEIVQAVAARQQKKGREFTRNLEKRIPTKQEESKRIRETFFTREEVIEHLSKTVGNETMQIVLGELDKNPGAFMEDGNYRVGAVKSLVKDRFKDKDIDFTKAKKIPAPTEQKPLEETVSETQTVVPPGKGELYKGPSENNKLMLGKRIQNYVKERATKLEQQIELTADEVTYFVEEASQKYFILGGGFDFPKVDMMVDEWLGKCVARKPVPKAIKERLAVVKHYEDKKKAEELKKRMEDAKMQESKVQSQSNLAQPDVGEPEARKSHIGYVIGALGISAAAFVFALVSYLLAGSAVRGSVDYSAVEKAAKKAAVEVENTLAAKLAGYPTREEQKGKDDAQDGNSKDIKDKLNDYGNVQKALAEGAEGVKKGIENLDGKIEQLTLNYDKESKSRDEQLAGIAAAQASAEKKIERMKTDIEKVADAQKQADENAKVNYNKQEKQLELFAESEAKHYSEAGKKIDGVADNLKKFEEGFAAYVKEQEKKKEEKKETLIGPPEPEKKKDLVPVSPEKEKKPGEKKVGEEKVAVTVKPYEPPKGICVRELSTTWDFVGRRERVGDSTVREKGNLSRFNLAYGINTAQLALGVNAHLGDLWGDIEGGNDLTDYLAGLRFTRRLGDTRLIFGVSYLTHTRNQDGKTDDGIEFSKLGELYGWNVSMDIRDIPIYNISCGLRARYKTADGKVNTTTHVGGTVIKDRLDTIITEWEISPELKLFGGKDSGLYFRGILGENEWKENDMTSTEKRAGVGLGAEIPLYKQLMLFADIEAVHCKRDIKGISEKVRNDFDFKGGAGIGLRFW